MFILNKQLRSPKTETEIYSENSGLDILKEYLFLKQIKKKIPRKTAIVARVNPGRTLYMHNGGRIAKNTPTIF